MIRPDRTSQQTSLKFLGKAQFRKNQSKKVTYQSLKASMPQIKLRKSAVLITQETDLKEISQKKTLIEHFNLFDRQDGGVLVAALSL